MSRRALWNSTALAAVPRHGGGRSAGRAAVGAGLVATVSLALLLEAAPLTPAFATAYTWGGGTSTDWNTASNWSPAAIPNSVSADTITVSSGGNQPQISGGNADSILGGTLNSGASLTITGGSSQLTVGTTGLSASGATVTTSSSGTLRVNGASNTIGTLTNNAFLILGASAGLTVGSGGTGGLSGSGGVTIGSGATLTLNGGSANTVGSLTDSGNIVLNGNTITVSSGYNNNNSGTGNSFDKHKNVSGLGAINAGGSTAQSITGTNVTGGAGTTPTLALGNVHVGGSTSQTYQIKNSGASGPSLRGALQTTAGGASVTDSRLSGTGVTAGNWGALTPGNSTTNYTVTFTGTTAGALTGQKVHIANLYDNVAEQTMSITGAAYRLATGTVNTSSPVAFGNHHVGDVISNTALSISNTAVNDGFSEGLDVGVNSTTGGASTNGGSITNLAAGSTNNTAITIGISTGTAGDKSGSVVLNMTSDGSTTSGLANTSLGTSTVNVTGAVYNYATATVNNTQPLAFGNHHVGDGITNHALSITNSAAAGGFSEGLDASVGGTSGGATTNGGSITNLAAGSNNNTAITVGIDTSSAGDKSGSVSLSLASNGTGTSGLGNTSLSGQNVNVTGAVYNYATATVNNTQPLAFGNHHVGDGITNQALSITNSAAAGGFSEGLDAGVGGTSGGVTTNAGSITNLAAGSNNNTAITVGIDTSSAGDKSGAVSLSLASNGTGTSGLGNTTLSGQNVNVTGAVYNYATATVNNTQPIAFGNHHVGDIITNQALSITNSAAAGGFSEGLDASVGGTSGGVTTNGGSITNLAAGSNDNTAITVGIDTSSVGDKSGSVSLSLASNGTGTSGLGNSTLSGQNVSVTGSVYRLASGTINNSPIAYGIVHVGDSLTQTGVSLTNSATNDGFSEKLNASVSGTTGGVTTNGGSVSLLAAGGTDNSSIKVGIDTSSAGVKNGQATLSLVSDGTGTSGLGTTGLTSQDVSVTGQVNNYANAGMNKTAGTASFSHVGSSYTLNFGNVVINSNHTATLNVENIASILADTLKGNFSITSGSGLFGLGAGFGSTIDGLGAGGTSGPLTVSFNQGSIGFYTEVLDFNWWGYNSGGYTDPTTQDLTLTLQANATGVPEPASFALMLTGLAGLAVGASRRRGSKSRQ